MKIQSARAVSLDILEDILNKKAYNNIAISLELNKRNDLDAKSRGFITELTNGVLRNLTHIDYVITQFSKTPITKMKPVILNILRQGVYQIIFMQTADYAICDQAVELAKSRGLGGLSGFVNGVLRNIQRSTGSISYPDKEKELLKYLSVYYSHPSWIVKRWVDCYGADFTEQMLKKNNEPPRVTICANTLKITAKELIPRLEAEGVFAEQSQYDENAVTIKNSGFIGNLESYKEGLFHVQDLASQTAIRALAPQKGNTVMDLCAAPGGKSFMSAYVMENTGTILAGDIYTHKIKLIEEGAKRLGINIIEAKKQNAEIAAEDLKESADCVIVDAPCTGLGIIRKRPDIKLNRSKEDIKALQSLQRSILTAAQSYVRPGGCLLYTTCTITDEENIENVNWFLEKFSFEKQDFAENISAGLRSGIKDGCLYLYPHIHGSDGFFICKLIKRG